MKRKPTIKAIRKETLYLIKRLYLLSDKVFNCECDRERRLFSCKLSAIACRLAILNKREEDKDKEAK